MKKLIIIFLASLSGFSQERTNNFDEWTFKFGVNMVDSRGNRNVVSGITQLEQNAFGSIPLTLGLEKRLNKNFGLTIQGSLNSWEELEGVIDGVLLKQKERYYALDINGKVYLNQLLNFGEGLSFLDLYGNAGLGYFVINRGTFTYNYGVGVSVWLTDRLGLDFNTTVKSVFSETEMFESGHFLYSFGLLVQLGRTKSSKQEMTNGSELRKDSDSDGVPDDKDYCVNTPGSPMNNGCPFVDSDKDGVVDSADHCPQIKGDLTNHGCPTATKKPVENKIIETVNDTKLQLEKKNSDLNALARGIKFESGNYNFTQDTYPYLLDLSRILSSEPNSMRFKIIGHTDSSGSYEANRKLSYMRASAVRNYLVDSGILKDRIDIEGLGEAEPIETNLTKEGRSKNRRVEIKILSN